MDKYIAISVVHRDELYQLTQSLIHGANSADETRDKENRIYSILMDKSIEIGEQ